MRGRWLLPVLCLCAILNSPLIAQDPPIPQSASSLQVTSRLVVLDVVVVDHYGRPVTNLDQSNFSVYEDKVPQTIKSFEPVTSHQMPHGSAT